MPSWRCIKKQAYAFSKYNPASRDASLTHPEGSPGPAAASGTQATDTEKFNSMDFGEFVDVFGNVIERCPLIAAAVGSQRPSSDLEDLEQHLVAFTEALPQSGKEGVPRCHRDLAGRELQRGERSAESRRGERSAAGLTSLGAAERLRLAEPSAQYRARSGFPFALAARLCDWAAVPRERVRWLHCPAAQALSAALREVKKVGRRRLAELLGGRASRGPGTHVVTRGGRGRARCACNRVPSRAQGPGRTEAAARIISPFVRLPAGSRFARIDSFVLCGPRLPAPPPIYPAHCPNSSLP
ncbi:putative 2-oxo-4-hydroxy-4-carboxy-5-ureidoimidazoline decarboxylase [Kogia breviceps]|uniref:putative 2-oxo-4-hydroxy-4-carboxy-5-ureidoimidazoline decarboxylase n=1 Tax=Kogia breviceps TaxID=27615 RepID=UPI002796104D|nr:putative 2-oxo-4-hydroxy-4-carboxy-5-ureidoimidazoline decarboxylase [Kogia breviceps]